MDDCFKIPTLNVKVKTSKPKTQNVSDDNKNQTVSQPEFPYIEPKWSQKPNSSIPYYFEVLKNGVIIEKVKNLQEKSFWVFGRLPDCHVVLAHPTISRFHAVLQYRPELEKPEDEQSNNENEKSDVKKHSKCGWYLYDLNSTHGTFLNKNRIPSKTYVRVKVGHMITLGASTRKFILFGPDYDEEEESDLTVTEIKEQRLKREQEYLEKIEKEKHEKELLEKKQEEEGISWGMGEDADEETDLTVNPYASTNNEELFLEDPKKTLRGFFEREGLNLEYNVDDMSQGTFVCRVELPIDDAFGKPMIAEVCHRGKKKDAVFQCALEACRILDRQGILRTSTHEPRRSKIKENSDSDDDEFLDRTGDVEKRRQRKKNSHSSSSVSYQELIQQEVDLLDKISKIQNNLDKYQNELKELKNSNEKSDDLDSFMDNLKHESKIDKTEARRLRYELQSLKQDHTKLQKLIKIATPLELPLLIKQNDVHKKETNEENKNSQPVISTKKFNFPLFGKRNKVQTVTSVNDSIQKPTNEKIESNKKSDDEEIENEVKDKQNTSNANIETKEENTNIIKGPTFDSEFQEKIDQSPCKTTDDEKLLKREHEDNEIEESNITTTNKKSKRSRNRIRERARDLIDGDTENVKDSEKFSNWVPPENQTGDGFTELNDKFGY